MNYLNCKKRAASLAECDSRIQQIQQTIDHLADRFQLSTHIKAYAASLSRVMRPPWVPSDAPRARLFEFSPDYGFIL